MPDVGLGLPVSIGTGGGFSAPGVGVPDTGLGLPSQGNSTAYGNTWGKIQGFAMSAFDSFPEMFGIEPSPSTQAFRAANPVSGFLSGLVGMAIPYGAAAKGISMVPKLAGIVEAAPAFLGVAERPILSMAAKAATETGLIEAGRLGISATPIPEEVFGRERTQSLPSEALSSAMNIAGGGALGAIGGAIINRLPKGQRIADLVPEAHPSFPLVTRIRALDDAVTSGTAGIDGNITLTEDQVAMLAHQREQLRRANFADIDPAYTDTGHARISEAEGAKYNGDLGDLIGPLEGDRQPSSGRSYTDALNVMFNPNKRNVGRVGETRLLTVDSEKGFPSQGELDTALEQIGLTKDQLANVGQNQRVIKINEGTGANPNSGVNAAKAIENTLTGTRRGTLSQGMFERVANDWFINREADNGLWVAAKKIQGEVGKPAPGDQWFLMRTDKPDVLDPQAAAFKEITINRSAYWPAREIPNIGVDTADIANMFRKEFEPILSMPKWMKPTVNAFKTMGRDISELAANYLAPAIGIAARNKKANYALNMMKSMTDFEEAVVGTKMNGARWLDENKPAWGQIVGLAEPKSGGYRDMFKALAPEDLADIKNALVTELPFNQARELALMGHLTPDAFKVLTELHREDIGFNTSMSLLKEHMGAPNAVALLEDYNQRTGHYGISQTRRGGFYALIDDTDSGELAGMAMGNTAKEARDAAVKLIAEQAKTTGRPLALGGLGDTVTRDAQQALRIQAAVRKPGFLRPRGDLIGHDLMKGDLTAEKLSKAVEGGFRSRERFKTNIVLQEQLWDVMRKLRNEDSGLHNQMEKRLAILQGDEGEFARQQNAIADKILGPIMGKDSATSIVRLTQQTMNMFQFGFGNLAHYALNAVSMFQTTFPEAAYVLRTAGRDMADYITVPMTDKGGRIIDSVNVLSDVKLWGSALKLAFGKGSDAPPEWHELMRQMIDQGIIAPRYAEAHFGSSGELVKDLKGAFSNGHSFVRWAHATNEVMLAKSEEFHRLIGVATGFRLTQALGIKDPYRIARFTREFMSKTAFNYTTMDRPTIFTTPMGSLLGTFKTWMFHYMANMAKYAGGGRETFAPLMWQTAMTAALGGAAATPLVVPMANAASRWFTDKDFMSTAYNGTIGQDHPHLVDGLMYGLPGLLGLSLASQASSPGSDPARDAQMMFSFAIADRMKNLGKAAGDAFVAWKATGVSPWDDDNIRNEMARALAPRTIYRAMAVAEDHAIKSLNNGYRVMDNVSIGDGLLYAMGFNPVELEKTYHAYNAIRQDEAAKKALVSEMGRQLNEAWTDNDDTAATRIFTRAMAVGLDTASVMRSAKAMDKRDDVTQLEFVEGKDRSGQAAQDWGFVNPHGHEGQP